MNTAQEIQKSPAKVAGFEIEDLDAPEQVTHKVGVVFNDEGDAISGFIIVGKDSPQYQDENSVIRQENIQRASKRNKQIDTSTPEGAKLVATTLNNNEKRLALAVTVGWFGFNSEGAELAFSKQMTEKMYTKKPTWLEKVNAALDADANFIKV
jgi:hypothetical protein